MGRTETERPIRFRVIDRNCSDEPDGRDPSTVDRPDPMSDYRESALSEILSFDLTKAVLFLEPSYFCNLRCTFCALPVWSRTTIDWERLSTVVQSFALCGLRSVTLTGGEPGIVPGLDELLQQLRSWGMRVTMLTHGLWAANSDYLDRLVTEGRLESVMMSIKAFDAESFGSITARPRLHSKQATAMANLARAHGEGRLRRWTVNHVITDETIERLRDLSWLDGLPARPEIVFSLMEPYLPEMTGRVPTPDSLRQILPELIASLDRRGVRYAFEGLPLCALGPAWQRSRDIARRKDEATRILVQAHDDADYVLAYRGYQRLLQFDKPPACASCRLADVCPGVHMRTTSAWTNGGLSPFVGDAPSLNDSDRRAF